MRWTEAALAVALITCASGATAQMGRAARPASEPGAPPFTVVLDPAHGGSDGGARLRDGIQEKTVTLKLAKDLQALLQAQGIAVTMTRDGDVDLPQLNRAEMANHAQAAACLVIHATATGSGVHLFASSLAPVATPSGPSSNGGGAAADSPLPWATAQLAYVVRSLKLESELDAALSRAGIPVTMGRAAVEPMDNLACPAVAVELAPPAGSGATAGQVISSENYEQAVEDALAAAIRAWRQDGTEKP